MAKEILREFYSLEVNKDVISEAINNNRPVTMSGVLQRSDFQNQNGRIYPKVLLEREMKKYQVLINERRSLGQLDHPESSTINLSNVSHIVNECHWSGNDVLGTIEVLTTPTGNILRELIKCGVKIGISSRGVGSTKIVGNGQTVVQDDFEIICFDVVSNPSTHGAWMNVNESMIVDINETYNTQYKNIDQIISDILGDFTNFK